MRTGESPHRKYLCADCHPKLCGAPTHRQKARYCESCQKSATCYRCDVDENENVLWPVGASEFDARVYVPNHGYMTRAEADALKAPQKMVEKAAYGDPEVPSPGGPAMNEYAEKAETKAGQFTKHAVTDREETKAMSEKGMLTRAKDMAISDAKVVAPRLIARQTVRLFRDSLVAGIEGRTNMDPMRKEFLKAVLTSPAGEGAVSVALGVILTNTPLPGIEKGAKTESLAAALRQVGEEQVADFLLESFMADLRGILTDAIRGMPDATENTQTQGALPPKEQAPIPLTDFARSKAEVG